VVGVHNLLVSECGLTLPSRFRGLAGGNHAFGSQHPADHREGVSGLIGGD
jgi:hypothetical protein